MLISKLPGRDHWGAVQSVFFAGGGVKGGTIVGASDASEPIPTTDPQRPENMAATIYHALGSPARSPGKTTRSPAFRLSWRPDPRTYWKARDMTPRKTHHHISASRRRELLQVGYSGLLGLGLPTLLAAIPSRRVPNGRRESVLAV